MYTGFFGPFFFLSCTKETISHGLSYHAREPHQKESGRWIIPAQLVFLSGIKIDIISVSGKREGSQAYNGEVQNSSPSKSF